MIAGRRRDLGKQFGQCHALECDFRSVIGGRDGSLLEKRQFGTGRSEIRLACAYSFNRNACGNLTEAYMKAHAEKKSDFADRHRAIIGPSPNSDIGLHRPGSIFHLVAKQDRNASVEVIDHRQVGDSVPVEVADYYEEWSGTGCYRAPGRRREIPRAVAQKDRDIVAVRIRDGEVGFPVSIKVPDGDRFRARAGWEGTSGGWRKGRLADWKSGNEAGCEKH